MRTLLAAALATVATGAAGVARAQPLTRDDLLEALQARDAQIAALQARVEALERERAATPAHTPIPAAAPATTPPPAGPAAPSTAGDDEEVALQALSRTLVERGGQLLPAWRAEVTPTLAYSNREVQGLALAPTPEGIPTVADQRLRVDQLHGGVGVRVGLPWASQLDVSVPYVWIRQSRALADGAHAISKGSGVGDVSVELSHEIFRESGWRPDLVGGVSYRFATGRDPFRVAVPSVATGSGSDQLRARLTAVKSAEPLVFFGTLSYAHDFAVNEELGRIEPGDAIGLDLGALVALSPDSSLTFALSQEFRSRSQIAGAGAPGTDTTASVLQIGLAQVLSPRVLLDVSLGVGLTRDAPDYALQIALPIRLR